MSLCSREKQRDREVLGAFLAAQKGQIENSIFVNPSDTRGFTAQKKPVFCLADNHLAAGRNYPEFSEDVKKTFGFE